MESEEKSEISVAKADIEDIEEEALLNTIFKKYGYDYREYSKAHVKRRLLNRMRLSNIESISMMQHKVLRDPVFAAQLLKDLSIRVTEMFRDPDFYKAFRENVVPLLKTWPFLKIWHAGCSTGEEVYSMAILLKEEGLYHKSQIYATDFNNESLDNAREGIYSAESMKKYARNFQATEPKTDFADYYHAKYDSAIMDPSLKKILFGPIITWLPMVTLPKLMSSFAET